MAKIEKMNPRDPIEPGQPEWLDPDEPDLDQPDLDQRNLDQPNLDRLNQVFSEQLLACLDACARGRRGLFSEAVNDDAQGRWPEAARLRELAVALQTLLAQQQERNALCDEFLDLCTIHGESNPGERKLARALLERIERGEVGAPTEEPWR